MLRIKTYALLRPFIRAVLPAPFRAGIFAFLVDLKRAVFWLIASEKTLLYNVLLLKATLLTKTFGALALRLVPNFFGSARRRKGEGPAATSDDDLRRFNEQAIIALNNVDIAGCIRNAMPGATQSCAPEQLQRLQLKEQACYCLAVATLQGLGRLDEAIFWWREQRRLATAIIRQCFGAASPVHDPRELIFDRFWSSHVGHTAMLGIHVKRNLLEGEPYRALTLIRALEPNSGNRRLVEHWQQYFTLVEDSGDPASSFDYQRYISKGLFLEERLAGPETYFWRAYAEISRAWELAGGGALLELPSDEIERGQRELAAMGIPREDWYVCLHVRAPGFKPVHEELQSTLNAGITSYDLAIDAIVERGGWVIRMGDPSMPKLPARKRVVDYAHSPCKSAWMDLFLCGTCRFYIGTSSGLAYVPNLFGTSSVFTNWFPTGTRPLNSSDIFIPKMHWYDEERAFAPFAESLAPPLGHIHVESQLRALGVSLRDNTREDLRDAVIEMLDRFETRAGYSAEDEQLQARFDAVANNSRCFGNARIGRDFIRKYRRLLPSAEPRIQ